MLKRHSVNFLPEPPWVRVRVRVRVRESVKRGNSLQFELISFYTIVYNYATM